MVPNPEWWARYFRRVHIRAIEGFRAGALEKVAPAFSGLAEEADAAVSEEFERRSSMPTGSSIDMSIVADCAFEHGLDYYLTMKEVEQNILNLLAVGLHHMFEQQQFFSHRRLFREESVSFRTVEFERRLADCGIDCRSFECTGKLYELKMAANTIKHGSGSSANKLASLRPDLFQHPILSFGRENGDEFESFWGRSPASSFLAPLTGDGLYVSDRDLSEWCAAATAYWEELSARLDEQHRLQSAD